MIFTRYIRGVTPVGLAAIAVSAIAFLGAFGMRLAARGGGNSDLAGELGHGETKSISAPTSPNDLPYRSR